MPDKKPFKVLVLCTGNSARSIIAEYLWRRLGKGRFETYSAGSTPTGKVNPLALWVLKDRYDIDAGDARSKSWEEFKAAGVQFDFVITVCDKAQEACPVWPGQPIVAHWGSPDPAAAEGTEAQKRYAFIQVASQIYQRISLFCAFSDEKLEPIAIKRIGDQFKIQDEGQMAR
ncbi:MAG: arsenate reductase ArsC [Opitutaceae bacterium]|nr:arsenate reductase ArsC [Opitutaceae bacterium]